MTCKCNTHTNFELVKIFHRDFGTVDPSAPVVPPFEIIELRAKLIFEEFKELLAELGYILAVDDHFYDNCVKLKPVAAHTYDLKKIAKESADLKVVVYGTDAAFGIDADKAFQAVNASNMSKLTADGTVLKREDGKILKSDQYREPDMSIIFADA